ncbi:MAG: hypothetical protein IJY79_04555 [Clostridia bacterium]|nr:hypothetical protein [Clostridia bacterium]
MKANELLNSALKMLGYTNADGNAELTGRIRNSAIVAVNLVYGDLWRMCNTGEFEPIESLDYEIKLPQKAMGDVFLYGLAMHIARSENDGDQQQYFAALYNAKRAGLTTYDTVRNALPHPDC